MANGWMAGHGNDQLLAWPGGGRMVNPNRCDGGRLSLD
jgi:hypothetical protein